MTYRQIIYICLDLLKVSSDDSYYTEDHALFLATKVRGLLLKQQYKDIKKEVPESNCQTLCLDLIQVPAISGEPCDGGTYLRSKNKIPTLMSILSPRIYTEDYYQGTIAYVSRERMRYVGHNKWLKNIIYASIGPDSYLYFKSSNPQYLHLEKINLTGVFENPEEAAELECNNNDSCDILDRDFPLEEGLVPLLIEMVNKYLSGAIYKPKDESNNASDDLSELATFLRNNIKSNLQKQIES